MNLSKITDWRNIPLKMTAGFLVSIVVLGYMVWNWSDDFIFTPAEAAETHAQMAKWELTNVRERIEIAELKKIETKHRPDLNQQTKDELAVKYDIKLKRLRVAEKCLTDGKLKCE